MSSTIWCHSSNSSLALASFSSSSAATAKIRDISSDEQRALDDSSRSVNASDDDEESSTKRLLVLPLLLPLSRLLLAASDCLVSRSVAESSADVVLVLDEGMRRRRCYENQRILWDMHYRSIFRERVYRFNSGSFFCINNLRRLLLFPKILPPFQVLEGFLGVMDDFLTGHALIV